MSFSGQASTFFAQQCNTWMARAAECLHLTNMPERAVSYRNHSSTAKPVKPRYQTVKVGAPQGTGQTCSCMDLVLMELGFSLQGIHCRNTTYIYLFPPFLCVECCACLSSWPQLESAEWWTLMSWAGCPRHCAGALRTDPGHPVWLWLFQIAGLLVWCWCLLPCAFLKVCLSVLQLFSSTELLSVVAEATGECGWAGVFLCVGHAVKSREQCLLSNGTFRWDELLVIRLIRGLLYAKPFPAPSLLDLSVNDPLFRLLWRDLQQGLLSFPSADVWPAPLR